ncbi:hypothetical protein ElyMa_001622000 [Elysia marginata]|uniref:Uncharacterized protein n=1 Tax=Elysia marginata TaxID=1093978 RepID=A0AAV4JJ23_9GAST|nr:hypothetical protein ElyMa_001622000 [Elysia marginata]
MIIVAVFKPLVFFSCRRGPVRKREGCIPPPPAPSCYSRRVCQAILEICMETIIKSWHPQLKHPRPLVPQSICALTFEVPTLPSGIL